MEDTLTPGLGGTVFSRMDASDFLALCLVTVIHEVTMHSCKDDVVFGQEVTVMRSQFVFKSCLTSCPHWNSRD